MICGLFRILCLRFIVVVVAGLMGTVAGAETAQSTLQSTPRLNVGIVEFDPGISEDTASHRRENVFPNIRKAEARYLPFLLRQTLIESDQWGVVRIMPKHSASADVLVRGEILRSDGQALTLHVRVEDSAGRTWLNKQYSGLAETPDVEGERKRTEPFQAIYKQISQDLLSARQTLSNSDLKAIPTLSTLRYGVEILPEFFTEYLSKNDMGFYEIRRMPAKNDPMLSRIERMQAYEHLFIDTADEQYQTLQFEIRKTYDLWRDFSREQIVYMKDFERRNAEKGRQFRRGSFAAMTQSYGDYEWFRRQEQNQIELAKGFSNETVPTLIDLDDRVVTLSGNLQEQYEQWRDILRSMLVLERGEESVENKNN